MSDVVLKVLWIYGLMAGVAMLIAGVIKLIVWLLNRVEREAVARPAPVPASTGSIARAVPAEHLAVITAAVYAAIGAHRIVHIEEPRSSSRWGLEGRSTHQRSHKPSTHRPSH